ncbi:hypothetical protein JCM8202_001652 [Rhodotorula sphaerocarpa]
MNTFAGVRLGLWCWFFFASLITWVLAAAFVGRTEHDFGFYANSAIVILVAGLLGNTLLPLWCAHPASDELGLSLTRTSHAFASVGLAYARSKAWQYGSMILEFVATFVVWALMLGGAAALSNRYNGWVWCFGSTCNLARSVEAWAWISWITLTFLLIFIGIQGCMGPETSKHDRNAPTGVGQTEMGMAGSHHGMGSQAPVSAGQQPMPTTTAPNTGYAPNGAPGQTGNATMP